eukprot:m.23490 g.23490  ORF g.23490 m.23490 type:complete len:154 (+) comp10988_c0_seq2:137-598(+)
MERGWSLLSIAAAVVLLLPSHARGGQLHVATGKCAVLGEECVCTPVSQCTQCDPFEMTIADNEMDDPDWCLETGYKRRVHCVFTNSGDHEKVPQDTYESCSPASSDRIKFFTFEAMCAIVGLVFVFGANKRKALLYDRIERKLRQQIDNVDMV